MCDQACDFHPNNVLGVHQVEHHPGTEPFQQQLQAGTPKKQKEQFKDEYNLGSGQRTDSPEEAADALLQRTYPEIANNTQTAGIFIPESFIPRVPLGVDPKNYDKQFKALSEADKSKFKLNDKAGELQGDMVEKSLYEQLKEIYKEKPVVVLQGAELLIPKTNSGVKRGEKQESDVIIINNRLKYVMNIEAKKTLSTEKKGRSNVSTIDSALSQIEKCKRNFETYFSQDIGEWKFIGVIFYDQSNGNICKRCECYVMSVDDIKEKIKTIEEEIEVERASAEDQSVTDYQTIVKRLVFTIYANPGPVIKSKIIPKITDAITTSTKTNIAQGDYRSVLFWTPTQFQIMHLDGANVPIQKRVLLNSCMSTGKTEVMKGMMRMLLDEGQRCHFIICQFVVEKKSILQVQLENEFQKEKEKGNIVFSFLNCNPEKDNMYDLIQNKISEYPGYNTFIDEMVLDANWSDNDWSKIIMEDHLVLWVIIAAIHGAKQEDFAPSKMKLAFPNFFIPDLKIPLRNCKQIVKYVQGDKSDKPFLAKVNRKCASNFSISVPEQMIDGLAPTEFVVKTENIMSGIQQAIQRVKDTVGDRGVTIIICGGVSGGYDGYTGQGNVSTNSDRASTILSALESAGRNGIVYSSHTDQGVSEERLAEWIKDRKNTDLVVVGGNGYLCRGWEDQNILVVDYMDSGLGMENMCMRTITNLLVVRCKAPRDERLADTVHRVVDRVAPWYPRLVDRVFR
eukprot:GFUD01040285.1.p1 GENE.GFUD01040285.1~~GFUD01040285.1.p1  ORF type:complete len:735 (+),score=159.46 GFUD01040285.1:221-2425(+)